MQYLTERLAARCGVDLHAFAKQSFDGGDAAMAGAAGIGLAGAGAAGAYGLPRLQGPAVAALSDQGRLGTLTRGRIADAEELLVPHGGQRDIVKAEKMLARRTQGVDALRRRAGGAISGMSPRMMRGLGAAGGVGAAGLGAAGVAGLAHLLGDD